MKKIVREGETVYRLRRVYTLFSLPMLKILLALLGVYAAMLLIWWLSDVSLGKSAGGIGLFLLAYWLFCTLFRPKQLSVYQGRLRFEARVGVHDRFRRGGRLVRVTYEVSEIRELAFHQNPLERLFDVGHISFSGEAILDTPRAADLARLCSPKSFVIYGIPNFSLFQLEFRLDR